ncbi:TPA: nuclear transport factor 2 family protein [Enterobacter hormaechei subsp. xiangfangensis]|uniref:nuclear transport factor 2 family protein n=1 Tax=Enterobacter hormaechei TaxID=158836 RepID=UPI0034CDA169|nr:nuclear transport factor 2 family protein [Enterobacter hormaechei subsp. xiangfangensis]HCJ6645086.1 nuclear transport factor 2 family protein [Enterobacter hormaechei subsp. xiangfangensis]HCJ7339933.1 nuclear transport factor 2 family protein [Enterobacter hormaechei subsp. xiangfangensis]HCR0856484.1 nuclear transport factor 2 family protein [Enterobacter hormaechei]
MSTLPSVISRFVDYYATLDTQPPSALAGIYRADATLIDPFGEHSGVFAIQRYFTHLLANVQHCRFTVDAPLRQIDRFVVTWMMHWSHPRIAGGAMRQLPGCSVVDMRDDRIVRQRDYYDAGEMIYEHLPILGWAVRGVKRRVKS